MIKTFASQETQKIFERQYSRRIPSEIQDIAYRKLVYLHSATNINDLRIPPANHLEKLTGNRQGQFSIRINKQWRICFECQDDNAYQVEIVDYH